MSRARRETEVKLRFDSPSAARDAVRTLGAVEVEPRHFEDNVVYDTEDEALRASGRLLRLRRAGSRALLTFKAPVEGRHRYKVREEAELEIGDAHALERVLAGLGFRPRYRYQKYRTLYALESLHVCVDETPIGCFVELEGSPAAIDRAAARMGLGREHYLLETYRELQRRHAGKASGDPGNLVFPSDDRRADR